MPKPEDRSVSLAGSATPYETTENPPPQRLHVPQETLSGAPTSPLRAWWHWEVPAEPDWGRWS